MILDIPSYRLDTLKHLKPRFRTFLLSNTNDLHIAYFHNRLKAEHGINDLSNHFEEVYYSYQIHLRKPDKEIFEYVLQKNKLRVNRTLFIDDTIRHIESAKSLGIQTLHVDSSCTLDKLYAALSEY
ncbi:MAG: HAD-IA family hydrolase [Prevotellaceae bacterium]|jgi:putative hydrolase of the HAD superfamily|nr:HAD-IA family hydrolase [Prevotellaceae bacterium]